MQHNRKAAPEMCTVMELYQLQNNALSTIQWLKVSPSQNCL